MFRNTADLTVNELNNLELSEGVDEDIAGMPVIVHIMEAKEKDHTIQVTSGNYIPELWRRRSIYHDARVVATECMELGCQDRMRISPYGDISWRSGRSTYIPSQEHRSSWDELRGKLKQDLIPAAGILAEARNWTKGITRAEDVSSNVARDILTEMVKDLESDLVVGKGEWTSGNSEQLIGRLDREDYRASYLHTLATLAYLHTVGRVTLEEMKDVLDGVPDGGHAIKMPSIWSGRLDNIEVDSLLGDFQDLSHRLIRGIEVGISDLTKLTHFFAAGEIEAGKHTNIAF